MTTSSLDVNGTMKSFVKQARRASEWSCGRSVCFKSDDPTCPTFKRCAQCRTVYCSRECQKQDWPSHKPLCKVMTPECHKVEKNLTLLSSNPYLRLHFEIMAILLFKMHLMTPASLAKFREKPFQMDVFLQQEPADIEDFFRMYRRSAVYDMKRSIMGMPQIVNVVAKSGATPQEVQRWKDEVDANEFSVSSPAIAAEEGYTNGYDRRVVGFVRFQHRMPAGSHFRMAAVSSCITISAKAMGITKEMKTATIEHELAGMSLTYLRPASLDTFIELINATIRRDTTNAWCLRMELPEYERWTLALGAPPYDASWLNVIFTRVTREKVKRELIYSVAGQHYGYNIEGVTKITYLDAEGGGKVVVVLDQAEHPDDSSAAPSSVPPEESPAAPSSELPSSQSRSRSIRKK